MLPTGILSGALLTSEAGPFVYLASVCRSLQCLISALTQAGGGGLLFRFTCSVLLQGGRGAADKCHWRVWGALAVFRSHWVFPHSRVSASPVYTAQASGRSVGSRPCVVRGSSFWLFHKSTDSVGPAFCAFPGLSSSGSQQLDGCCLPGAVYLIPSAVPASVSARSGLVCLVSVLGSWSLAATLPVDVDHPESQEVFG